MEEYQEITRPRKMGVMVLRRIVRSLLVHGRMVSNAKGIAIFQISFRGTSFRPKIWSFVARKWPENRFFQSRVYTMALNAFINCGVRLTMRSSRSLCSLGRCAALLHSAA